MRRQHPLEKGRAWSRKVKGRKGDYRVNDHEKFMEILWVILSRAAIHVSEAADEAQLAAALLHQGDTLEARQKISEAARESRKAYEALNQLGVRLGEPHEKPERNPLEELQSLSSPSRQALLEGLRQLLPLAEVVDAEDGNVLPDHLPLQPGETRGTNWAESLSNIAELLRQQVEGPRGRD